jgi:hypothetical protein
MRVTCPHCLSTARITSSNKITPTITDLYCQCLNTRECGGSFVYTLAFKNTLNPPINSVAQMAQNLLNNLTRDQRAAVVSGQVDVFN